ncbi:MAG TPA: amidase, partial [Erythrobacter sp.]|nr:amidase [Erythrobacter sp.]
MQTYAALIALALASVPVAAQDAAPPPGSPNIAERHALERYQRILELDDGENGLNAVIALNPDAGPEAGEAFDAGTSLGGRTVLVKDNVETRELPTTAGSLALKGNMTGRDAPM